MQVYDGQQIENHAAVVASLSAQGAERRAQSAEVWTIYDNTMHGAATRNALQLLQQLRSPHRGS